MANRLGPSWLNRVQQLAGPTYTGRFSRYAIMVDRINALEPALESCSDDELKSRTRRAAQGRQAIR
jgi:preprotein translocase subunit SecA